MAIMGPQPATVPALIDALGGNGAVAKIIGKGYSTVSEMRRSRSIHVRYWPAIIAGARDRGVDGINSELLMKVCINEAPAP